MKAIAQQPQPTASAPSLPAPQVQEWSASPALTYTRRAAVVHTVRLGQVAHWARLLYAEALGQAQPPTGPLFAQLSPAEHGGLWLTLGLPVAELPLQPPEPLTRGERPACSILCYSSAGDEAELCNAYRRLQACRRAYKLGQLAAPIEIYTYGPLEGAEPEAWQLQVGAPLAVQALDGGA